jgi:hypothetical protein
MEPDSRIPERPLTAITNFHAYDSRLSRPFYFTSPSPPPTTLAVNRESREETLRSYVVVRDDSGPRLFYNSMRDTLWVDQHEYEDDWMMLVERMSKSGTRVQRLAIHHDDRYPLYHLDFAERVRTFGIEQLFLVFDKEGETMPCVWPLVPRTRWNNGIEPELYLERAEQRFITLQFDRLEETSPGWTMPTVTAMERDYWEMEGLGWTERESHEVVLGEAFTIQSTKIMGLLINQSR